jgi:hypothetical protein
MNVSAAAAIPEEGAETMTWLLDLTTTGILHVRMISIFRRMS